MQITVTGRHMGVPEALKQYCVEKADRLPRFLDRIQSIEVVLDGKEGMHTAEMIVHAAGAPQPFVAREMNADAFAAVDLLLDKIEGQLRRYKEKHRNRKHPPRGSTELPSV
ncbi:MAG: ribosome-associated translation inhibitor RaiA [Phycisphaerae bacterium]|nr:ribosome-associated translation inhibitor RaiA [Phycisphaerae bacterium]